MVAVDETAEFVDDHVLDTGLGDLDKLRIKNDHSLLVYKIKSGEVGRILISLISINYSVAFLLLLLLIDTIPISV